MLAQPLIVTAQVSNGAVLTSVALFLDVDQSTIVPASAQQSTGTVNNNNNGGGITNNNNNGGSEAFPVPALLPEYLGCLYPVSKRACAPCDYGSLHSAECCYAGNITNNNGNSGGYNNNNNNGGEPLSSSR